MAAQTHLPTESGQAELCATLRKSAGILLCAGLFSVFVNLLMLTGPVFMLQVYDRVLPGRSEATLFALMGLVGFLYGIMGILDHIRGRLLARVGARFQAGLDPRVFNASLAAAVIPTATGYGKTGPGDLEAVQRLLASPLLATCFDLPFTPLFLVGIWVFHPLLGALALAGGGAMVVISVLSTMLTRTPVVAAGLATLQANQLSAALGQEGDVIRSLGMQDAARRRWQLLRAAALQKSLASTDAVARFSMIGKTLRLFLQSAMLGLGAWLVLHSELSPGAMIAASILLGRALTPVEAAIGGWAGVQQARHGWNNLARLLSLVPAPVPCTALPRPAACLQASRLTVIAPGETRAALRMIGFDLEPGQALGVIGPSGAGKTTLARVVTGAWRPAGGQIRLDGAALEHYGDAALGRHIGYLPQKVELFAGTIAENIAGLTLDPDPAMVVAAARKADAHQMILHLPDGYDTRICARGGRLSGGQIQRVGLARALFADPVIVVLDEPNSNLDNDGSEALNLAVRNLKASGAAVMIMAHRPAAIRECDLLLMLEDGACRAFGPRDAVLKSVLQNHNHIAKNPGPGGVS